MTLCVEDRLRKSGLRPTAQRLALADHLFADGHKHFTAEDLAEAMSERGQSISLATVYNALHQFTQAGLLRQIVIEPGKSYFDTNVTAHHHFYFEETSELRDISADRISVLLDGKEPVTASGPDGKTITEVDVIVRVR